MVDAIIIGAGYGGMSTAALLARSGLKTVVIEKSSIMGGRASSYTDDDGYTWEYGSHSLRLAHKGIANQLFERLGDAIKFLPHSTDARIICKDMLWDRPEGLLGFLKLPILPLRSRIHLLILMAKIRKADPSKFYDETLLSFYRKSFHDPELEEFLPFLGMTVMCPDPGRVSAGEVIAFLQRVFKAGTSVGEPVGGASQLFSKLKFHIETHGKILLNEKVTSILVADGHALGVETDRSRYPAKWVIFTDRLPMLFDVIARDLFPREFVSYCEGIEHSSSLVFDFITDHPVTDIRGSILGADAPVWARFQSNTDPGFTPHGKHISTWGIMLPPGFDGDPDIVAQTEKRLKITIAKTFPHLLPNLIKERKLIVPVMNGTVLTPAQSYPHRPGVKCPYIEGLFFAGDTVQGDGCSGDISFSSAMKAADCILAEAGKS